MTQASSAVETTASANVFHVDSEHSGIRVATMLLFIGGFLAGFFISAALINDAGINLLSVLVGILVAAGVTMLGEKQLKKIWKSGRIIVIDDDSVEISRKGVQETLITRKDGVSAILWSFKINRRSRMPKGYSMFAIALERDDERHLTAYTFMSPAQTTEFAEASRFKPIQSRKEEEKQAANALREDLREAGQQRRLREAENYRWLNGAEMTPEDFVVYIQRLDRQFSEWMPLH